MNSIKVKQNNRDLFRDVFSPMIFSDFFSPLNGRSFNMNDGIESGFRPLSDISETDESLNVSLSLAGYDKKDISIDIKEGVLTVSGEKLRDEEVKDERILRKEIRTGKFNFSVNIGEKVDSSKATATMDKGMLDISFPKAKSAMPRKIEVK